MCDICTVVYGLSVGCESRFVKRRRLGHHKHCNSRYLGCQYVHIIGASNLVAEGYHIRRRESIIGNVRTNRHVEYICKRIDSIGRKESAIREIRIDCDASNDRTKYLSTESNISSTGSKLNKCE